MRNRIAFIAALTAKSLFIVASLAAHTQQTVQLVPQVGMYSVAAVAFSPDGRLLLTGNMDNTARLWDAASGLQIRSFRSNAVVDSVAFSPDGRHVLTGSWDHTARLWDSATGEEIRAFEGHTEDVTSVAFSPNGRLVLTGSRDHTARLWDASSGQVMISFDGHKGDVKSVAFSPDGRFVLTGSMDHATRLWEASTGRPLRSFPGKSVVLAVAFSPDGRFVLTGNEDFTAKLFDAANGHKLRIFAGHKDWVESVAFSPDGRFVLTGSRDHSARLWDARTGQQLRSFERHKGDVYSVAFSPVSRCALTGGADNTAHLWNVATGELIRSLEAHTSDVSSVTFSADGRSLATGSWDHTARLWDLATGQERYVANHASVVRSVAFSPDSRFLVSASDDRTARLWDVSTGQAVRSFEGHAAQVESVAFSPDGRFLLTGSDDATARLWDVSTGRLIRPFVGHVSWVQSVTFSPNGLHVLTGSEDSTARLWDASTGQPIRSFIGPKGMVEAVAFSPDGQFVLTGSHDNTARIWDASTGQQVRSFVGHGWNVTSVAFSPDGRYVLTGSRDYSARLWDAESGEQLRSFTGSRDWVFSIAFSPGEQFVLTASDTTRLWDMRTGRQLASLISFTNGDWAVVDPDGRFDTNDVDGGAPLVWVASSEPMRPLPLEIFMRDYYTPRLLARIMNREPLLAIRSIAEINNRVQPDVEIASVRASTSHPGRADVVVHAASHTSEKGQASGLQDLRLFRNGQLVGYREGTLKDGDFTFSDIQLPTSAKSVSFTSYAFNSERIKSATTQKDYQYEPGPSVKPRAFLLQIGVNHYQASGCELHGSANDAEKLSEILTERLTKRGLDVKPVRLVSTDTEKGATRQEIREALQAIATVATPDDVFFLSFSGHGYGDKDGRFYILPSDVQGSCTAVDDAMLKGAISADELTEWLRPIDAGEMTFVLDSCDSASSVEANDFKPGPMGSRGLGQLAYDKRMRILAASQSNQAARESESLHQGLLSYALTQEGLLEGKADWKPVDQKITVGEWLSYAANEVPNFRESGVVKTEKGMTRIGAPTPNVKSAQIPAVFDFSKNDTFVLQ